MSVQRISQKDIEPGTPSSIFANLLTWACALPSIVPIKIEAICSAVKTIVYSLFVIYKTLR